NNPNKATTTMAMARVNNRFIVTTTPKMDSDLSVYILRTLKILAKTITYLFVSAMNFRFQNVNSAFA
ncbi:MAG: hypothetical protein VXY99_16030, partial [Pseudomonadota bacterium]|nr:hypothetical protein [Pseudomonadota bacterium]